MNRRGVLGMLGLGAAAGPAIAEKAISTAGSYGASTPAFLMNQYSDKVYPAEDSENPLQRLNNVREHFNHLSDKKKWIDGFISRELHEIYSYGNYSNQIDPDIMAMKSFSMSAKIRMHIQRRAERRYNENFFEASEQLKFWTEKLGL